MSRMSWREIVMWIPPAGTAAAGALAFGLIATVDDATTDRAERILGGGLAASPFIFLALAQASCAFYVGDRTGPPRVRGLVGTSMSAALGASLVIWVWVKQVARGYSWTDYAAESTALITLLLLPLPAAWRGRDGQR